MSPRSRKARVEDVHEIALAMPYVLAAGSQDNPVYLTREDRAWLAAHES